MKQIATKEKDPKKVVDALSSTSKPEVNVKITSSNRGAFLTETTTEVKPSNRKDSPQKTHNTQDRDKTKHSKESNLEINSEACHDIENKIKEVDKGNKLEDKRKSKSKPSKETSKSSKADTIIEIEMPLKTTSKARVPLKNLKPLTDSDDAHTGIPISKVEPLPSIKPKKKVSFCTLPPKVQIFQIEEGHQMKKTSLVKATLLDVPQLPAFSLEKLTLMKILRWNPHWLREQINNNEPPPILGHKTASITVLHSFRNHKQYVE